MNIAEMRFDTQNFADAVSQSTPKLVVLQNLVGDYSVHLIYHIQDHGVDEILIQDNETDSYVKHSIFFDKNMIKGFAFVK